MTILSRVRKPSRTMVILLPYIPSRVNPQPHLLKCNPISRLAAKVVRRGAVNGESSCLTFLREQNRLRCTTSKFEGSTKAASAGSSSGPILNIISRFYYKAHEVIILPMRGPNLYQSLSALR